MRHLRPAGFAALIQVAKAATTSTTTAPNPRSAATSALHSPRTRTAGTARRPLSRLHLRPQTGPAGFAALIQVAKAATMSTTTAPNPRSVATSASHSPRTGMAGTAMRPRLCWKRRLGFRLAGFAAIQAVERPRKAAILYSIQATPMAMATAPRTWTLAGGVLDSRMTRPTSPTTTSIALRPHFWRRRRMRHLRPAALLAAAASLGAERGRRSEERGMTEAALPTMSLPCSTEPQWSLHSS